MSAHVEHDCQDCMGVDLAAWVWALASNLDWERQTHSECIYTDSCTY